MSKKIVLLSGHGMSGKDSAYVCFKEILGDKCNRFAFADYLKEISREYFYWNGIKDEMGRNLLIKVGQFLRGEFKYKNNEFFFDNKKFNKNEILYINSDAKITPDTKNCFTYLDVFYGLFSRFSSDVDFWANKVLKDISNSSYEWNVITDNRFISEYNCIKKTLSHNELLITIRLQRESELKLNDRSETDMDNFEFNWTIRNNGSIEELKDMINFIIEKDKVLII